MEERISLEEREGEEERLTGFFRGRAHLKAGHMEECILDANSAIGNDDKNEIGEGERVLPNCSPVLSSLNLFSLIRVWIESSWIIREERI